MGSEAESEPSSIPKLPLFFSIQPLPSPEPSGMLTPPLQTSASVPFLWEEEPGKPRTCTTLITLPNPKCLELPPRLVAMEPKFTKTPSPTTVLDGPYVGKKPLFSSFRFITEHQGSFDNRSPDGGEVGKFVLEKKFGQKGKGIMGSWGQRTPKFKGGKKEVGGGSLVFSSSVDVGGEESGNVSSRKVNMGRIRRNGSFSSLSQARSTLWATIYEGFRQVIPWKTIKKSRK